MDRVYIDKCPYEIQEQKEAPVWYTVVYRPISSTASFGIKSSSSNNDPVQSINDVKKERPFHSYLKLRNTEGCDLRAAENGCWCVKAITHRHLLLRLRIA
jgi:hypothetical protein